MIIAPAETLGELALPRSRRSRPPATSSSTADLVAAALGPAEGYPSTWGVTYARIPSTPTAG